MRGSSPRMTPCQEILTLKVMRALEDAFLFLGLRGIEWVIFGAGH